MQTRLFQLFREYGTEAIELGMGTNRYGFKLKSHAVKFATNEDGRIDNFKEFKMAQRLQPYVIKVYEVSESGTLLVTEYIQPFQNFAELRDHEGKIKEILRELSAVYLIGDVGISGNNYGNWGVRVGTNDPVCLDFAYVYDVSSEIFLCPGTDCKEGIMLEPTADFVGLRCPKCTKETSFELIRVRIGKEAHSKEIGDLSDEAYVLEKTNTLMTLDPNRSPYLNRIQ